MDMATQADCPAFASFAAFGVNIDFALYISRISTLQGEGCIPSPWGTVCMQYYWPVSSPTRRAAGCAPSNSIATALRALEASSYEPAAPSPCRRDPIGGRLNMQVSTPTTSDDDDVTNNLCLVSCDPYRCPRAEMRVTRVRAARP